MEGLKMAEGSDAIIRACETVVWTKKPEIGLHDKDGHK